MNELEILAILRKKTAYWKTCSEITGTTHAQLAYFDFRTVEKEIEQALEKQADDMWAKERGGEMSPSDKSKIMNECYGCKHRREVPGNCHIQCVKPDAGMTGDAHGIKKGWFMYPLLFDPTWKTKLCSNFEPISAVSLSVSDAVSDKT